MDLNPIRAWIALTLQTSEYASIARRLREPASADWAGLAAEPSIAGASSDRSIARLTPIVGLLHHQLHNISSEQYIELVAWSATVYCPGKQHLECPSAALKAMGCDEAQWKEQLNAVRNGWRVVGGSVQMRELAQRIGQNRFKRRNRKPSEAIPVNASG